MDWMKAATDSVKNEVAFRLDITGSPEQALLQALEYCTAGRAAWSAALREMGWLS